MPEIYITHIQQHKDGKTITEVYNRVVNDKKELDVVADEIAIERGISTKDLFFIFKEKI